MDSIELIKEALVQKRQTFRSSIRELLGMLTTVSHRPIELITELVWNRSQLLNG